MKLLSVKKMMPWPLLTRLLSNFIFDQIKRNIFTLKITLCLEIFSIDWSWGKSNRSLLLIIPAESNILIFIKKKLKDF